MNEWNLRSELVNVNSKVTQIFATSWKEINFKIGKLLLNWELERNTGTTLYGKTDKTRTTICELSDISRDSGISMEQVVQWNSSKNYINFKRIRVVMQWQYGRLGTIKIVLSNISLNDVPENFQFCRKNSYSRCVLFFK